MKTLVRLSIIFLCENCGGSCHVDVPVNGEIVKSYCCKAKYKITSKGVNVKVKRMKAEKRL